MGTYNTARLWRHREGQSDHVIFFPDSLVHRATSVLIMLTRHHEKRSYFLPDIRVPVARVYPGPFTATGWDGTATVKVVSTSSSQSRNRVSQVPSRCHLWVKEEAEGWGMRKSLFL